MHLGEATKDRSRIRYLKAAVVEDREFCRFLEHYQTERVDDRPWRLVLAGDVFDFLAVSLTPDPHWALQRYGFRVTPHERRVGLDNTGPKTRWKLDRILERHRAIVTYLADFIGSGHSVVFLRGNHDAELFWPEVQEDLAQRLVETYFGGEEVPGVTPAAFRGRIEFRDWFFQIPGVVHLQHGHQYDPFCSQRHLLHPTRPDRPDLMEQPPTSLLIQQGIAWVPGVHSHDKDEYTFGDYMRWLYRLPGATALSLVRVYFRVLVEQVRYARTVGRAPADSVRALHAASLQQLARHEGYATETLERLDDLRAEPGNLRVGSVLRSLFFDSLGTGMALPLVLLVWTLASPLPWWGTALGCAGLVASAAALLRVFTRRRPTDQLPRLRAAAQAVAALVDAPLVVMGHSHRAEVVRLPGGSAYINTGCWLYPEGIVSAHESTCDCPPTYLEILLPLPGGPDQAGSGARLMRWCIQAGRPEPWQGEAVSLEPEQTGGGPSAADPGAPASRPPADELTPPADACGPGSPAPEIDRPAPCRSSHAR